MRLKNFLFIQEPLEFNLRHQLKNKSNLFKIKIFSKKIFRLTYKNFQRLFLRPSYRKIFQNIEKVILFNQNNKINKNDGNKITKLRNQGFLKIDNLFTDTQLKKIYKHLSSKKNNLYPVYTNHKNFKISNRPKGINTGYVDTNKIIKSNEIIEAISSKKLLNILNGYFQCKFKLDWIWAWWTFPSKNYIGPQKFHRDYESFNFIKLFVYLTNVDKDSGPHQYIIGSHKKNKFFKRERFEDNKVYKSFKRKNIMTIKGKKGTTFLADTFGVHRGLHPKRKKRLVLVYLFSVIPSNRSPKIPMIEFNKLKKKTKERISNKYLYDLFIKFS